MKPLTNAKYKPKKKVNKGNFLVKAISKQVKLALKSVAFKKAVQREIKRGLKGAL